MHAACERLPFVALPPLPITPSAHVCASVPDDRISWYVCKVRCMLENLLSFRLPSSRPSYDLLFVYIPRCLRLRLIAERRLRSPLVCLRIAGLRTVVSSMAFDAPPSPSIHFGAHSKPTDRIHSLSHPTWDSVGFECCALHDGRPLRSRLFSKKFRNRTRSISGFYTLSFR